MSAAKVQAMPAMAGAEVIETLEIAKLRPASWNARRTFGGDSQAELAASIRENGVQVPVLVRPRRLDQCGSFEIVAGHRRVLAAQAAGLLSVPCIVREMDDDKARQAGLVDNIQRENLPPIEEAEGLGELMKRPGATIDQVAVQVGKGKTYVGQRLQLLKATAPVKEALRAQAIELGHAFELARLTSIQQVRFLDELNCGYKAPKKGGSIVEAAIEKSADKIKWNHAPSSVATLRHEIERTQLRVLSEAPFALDAPLAPMPCTDCPKRSVNAGLLFADLATDTCTDRSCFDRKVQAFISGELEAARKEKRTLLQYSEHWTGEKGVVVGYNVTEVKSNACGHADEAIHVNGDEAGKKILICQGGSCKTHGHHAQSSGSRSSSPDPDRKKKLAKLNAEKKYRAALFAAVAAAPVPAACEQALNLEVCIYALGRSPGQYNKKAAEALGWPEKVFSWDGSKVMQETLSKLKPAERLRGALVAAHSGELGVNEYASVSKPDDLEKLAVLLGLDVKKIRAGVDAKAAVKPWKDEEDARKPVLGADAKKRIAAAQKKRWAKIVKSTKKTPAKKAAKAAAKKGGRK